MRRPVLPKESGFQYEFTNLFLLENAEYVPELLLRSEEEYRFYMELRRRTGIVLESNDSDAGGFELGDIRVLFDGGKIQVYRKGHAAGSCSVEEFSRHPNATFRRLQRYAEEME